MLTRHDRTVDDAFDVLEDVKAVGLTHVGFKDVGISPADAKELVKRIEGLGAVTYLEVVSTSKERALESAAVARDIGVRRLLGGTWVEETMELLKGSATEYYPFPGKPVGHPTKLGGTAADVEGDVRRFKQLGCAGLDLLAYRATEADPIELVKAARRGTDRRVLVAGSVSTAAQIRALKEAGADAFTIGSAAFDGSYKPTAGSLRSQLRAVLDACG